MYKWLVLLPFPNETLGTGGSKATDPVTFYYYRLPMSIESTGGYPEIEADLHDVLAYGILAEVGRIPGIDDPRAGDWEARYQQGLVENRISEGIRNKPPLRCRSRRKSIDLRTW
jgi:hypothetical protein